MLRRQDVIALVLLEGEGNQRRTVAFSQIRHVATGASLPISVSRRDPPRSSTIRLYQERR
jgi:hypothetical protein